MGWCKCISFNEIKKNPRLTLQRLRQKLTNAGVSVFKNVMFTINNSKMGVLLKISFLFLNKEKQLQFSNCQAWGFRCASLELHEYSRNGEAEFYP